jgi:hypothetical protein
VPEGLQALVGWGLGRTERRWSFISVHASVRIFARAAIDRIAYVPAGVAVPVPLLPGEGPFPGEGAFRRGPEKGVSDWQNGHCPRLYRPARSGHSGKLAVAPLKRGTVMMRCGVGVERFPRINTLFATLRQPVQQLQRRNGGL